MKSSISHVVNAEEVRTDAYKALFFKKFYYFKRS